MSTARDNRRAKRRRSEAKRIGPRMYRKLARMVLFSAVRKVAVDKTIEVLCEHYRIKEPSGLREALTTIARKTIKAA